jgi:hypothetical protein
MISFMRSQGRSIVMLCACWSAALCQRADAASMLRCETEDNAVSYVSTRIDHARCSGMSMDWRGASSASSGSSGSSASSASSAAPREAGPRRREGITRIYTWNEDGVQHYVTQKPPAAAQGVTTIALHFIEICHLCEPAAEVDIAALALDMRSYGREIDAASSSTGVDRALVRAVIHAESAYRADAISRAGAQGLMQLMPATASRFAVADPFDAAQNIRGGVAYLAWLLRRFGGDLDRALAAYNSGEASVDRYDGVPPYAETKAYVSRVKLLAERYRAGR